MIRCIFIILLIFTSLSCNPSQTQSTIVSANLPVSISSPETLSENKVDGSGKVIESFSDASRIGHPHRNKIHIDVLEGAGVDSASRPNNVAIIKFYSKNRTLQWVLKQTLEIEDYAIGGCYPKIEDFNNDGLKDFTFVSNTAARGANEVRTLLIYDRINDVLIHVKNSEDYPNLAYNKTLNCIDSWMFHAATTTVFLKLEGDMLREFASVGTGAERVVTLIDKNGKERVIRREKMKEKDIYTRYETFSPPKP